MPELPEVETIVSQLKRHGLEGKTIHDVDVSWPRSVDPCSVDAFQREVAGCRLKQISRYGKWIIFSLSSGKVLMIHLRMSGHFSFDTSPYDRVVFYLSDGLTLYFQDPRKFGRCHLMDCSNPILSKLGPDALTPAFDAAYLKRVLKQRKRALKPLLLDQAIVAGLGNIYVDEALWDAQLHPECKANHLTDAQLDRLYTSILKVLRVGIRNGGTSLGKGKSNYRDVDGVSGRSREEVKAYGRGGERCLRCESMMERTVVAQRGTHFCPICQTK